MKTYKEDTLEGTSRSRIIDFVHGSSPNREQLAEQVSRCVIDLIGALLGGVKTKAAKIAGETAAEIWPGEDCAILGTSRRAGMAGAVFANSVAANAIDIDDGFRPVKGHPGALVIPAALAVGEKQGSTLGEFFEAVVVGYELGCRGGIAWHDHYPVYHASGAWGAPATAAVASRLMKLNAEETAMALGIAEYQAPVNPMMRCIEHPSMVKDGIGWGAQAGVTAAVLASRGYTAPPSLLEFKKYEELVGSLGSEYLIKKLYFKPYACCRWAHPGISGVLHLVRRHQLSADTIKRVEIRTFRESASLKTSVPENTEEAQYNIAYPVAAAIIAGEVGPKQVMDEYIRDPRVLRCMEKIFVVHDPRFDEDFPERASSEVVITDVHGGLFSSGPVQARGDWDNPLTDEELKRKFSMLTRDIYSPRRQEKIYNFMRKAYKKKNYPLTLLLQLL